MVHSFVIEAAEVPPMFFRYAYRSGIPSSQVQKKDKESMPHDAIYAGCVVQALVGDESLLLFEV